MIIFHCDLDSTLIYSDRYKISEKKILLEEYDGGATYITQKTLHGLSEINEKVIVVPTTTRSQKLYNRINWQGCTFRYALVANGALLLEDGISNPNWKKETEKLIEPSKDELEKAAKMLADDYRRSRAVDFLEDSFLFTKVRNIDDVVFELEKVLDLSKVTVRVYKEKLYVLPIMLEKGEALRRFKRYVIEKEKLKESAVQQLAAGDGDFDISMIREADVGMAHYKLKDKLKISPESNTKVVFMGENCIFSDEIVSKLKLYRN